MRHKVLATMMALAVVAMGSLGCGGNNAKQAASNKKDVNWPTKPVQVIVPFSAGGDTDYNGRIMAKYLEKKLGKPFTVTNVVGGGGSIADNRVKNAKPDGYTVLVNHVTLNLSTASKVIDFSYKDYQMGGVFAQQNTDVVLVRGDSPWKSIKDLIEDSKKNPNKYKIAANTGTSSHYVAIALQNAGAQLNVVDSGGSSDRIVALLGGHVDVIPASYPGVRDYIKTGKFKVLAACADKRIASLPDVPTLKESGVDCVYTYNYTFFFPKGTDPKIAEKLSAAVKDIVENNKDYAAEIDKAYMQKPFCMNIADSEKFWQESYDSIMKFADKLQGKVQKQK
jgi:tripartite-type tricarboxylate transporter receptor subunit TctC